MGDEGKNGKRAGVPSWQLKLSEKPEKAENSGSETPAQETLPRASIIDQARKFLQDDEVRNSSTDKQIAFLEEKGLESPEIESLLGISRNSEATNAQPESLTSSQAAVTSPSIPQPSNPSSQPNLSRDGPPIITYPEFLTTPTHSPPLITARRLLTTLYFFGGISALLYGTSKYLIAPMVASLTESRHDLAETAQTNLENFIARLGDIVSEVPQNPSQQTYKDNNSDADSDSDPTELFHRDIGIQTSLPASAAASRPGTPTSSILNDQTIRLAELTSLMKDLKEASISEGSEVSELSSTIGVLKDYLDDLAYIPSSYKYGGSTSYGSASSRATEESMDEIAKLKAQIRGVKGVLLSARSFPSGAARAR